MSVFLLFFLHALRSGCVRACPWAGQATAVQSQARWSNRLAPSMLRCRLSNLWCGTCAVPSSFHSSSEPTPAETGICATTPCGRTDQCGAFFKRADERHNSSSRQSFRRPYVSRRRLCRGSAGWGEKRSPLMGRVCLR